MSADLAACCYLVAGALFILALRGLSNPETSRRGNLLGMIGMAIAVVTTLASHPPADLAAWGLVVVGMALGGGIGAVIARRVPMTSMPELVAAFHSLVGMAAVLVAAGALYAPAAFGIGTRRRDPRPEPDRNVARRRHRRHHLHRLGDRVPETVRPHERQADHAARPPRHQYRAGARRSSRSSSGSSRRSRTSRFWLIAGVVVPARRAHHHPDRRRRHAGRDLDAQFLFGLGGGGHRLHARRIRR